MIDPVTKAKIMVIEKPCVYNCCGCCCLPYINVFDGADQLIGKIQNKFTCKYFIFSILSLNRLWR